MTDRQVRLAAFEFLEEETFLNDIVPYGVLLDAGYEVFRKAG